MENEREKCANCDEIKGLIQCDECKKRVCAQCRHDGYTGGEHGVWVMTFCYDCQPHLRKRDKSTWELENEDCEA